MGSIFFKDNVLKRRYVNQTAVIYVRGYFFVNPGLAQPQQLLERYKVCGKPRRYPLKSVKSRLEDAPGTIF
jgi:hypothetical protein